MGGHGSGRKNRTTEIINSMKGKQFEPKNPIATEMFLPNLSGIASHPEFKNSTTFVKRAGDTMTGKLTIDLAGEGLLFKAAGRESKITGAEGSNPFIFETNNAFIFKTDGREKFAIKDDTIDIKEEDED